MDDMISRQVALDTLREAENHAFNGYYKGLAKAHKIVADLPSTQPEPCEDVVSREYLTEHIEACWMNGRMMKPDLNEVLSWIDDIPSAQPEIIMCKDCKYHRQNLHGDSWCAHSKGLDGYELMPTDFCCRGEWKEDENYKQN